MRIIFTLLLLGLVAGVGILALENRADMAFRYFGQSLTCPPAVLIGAVFLAGMTSACLLISFMRHLLRPTS